MPAALLGLLIGLLAAACVSPTLPAGFRFPDSGADTWDAPDGRRWMVLSCEPEKGGEYRITFVPEMPSTDEWTEKLSFAVSGPHMSKAELLKGLALIKEDFDPALDVRSSGPDRAFVLTYRSPRYNEHSVDKVVQTPRGYISISYRQRLGAASSERLAVWTRFIRGLPDKPEFWTTSTPLGGTIIRPDAIYVQSIQAAESQRTRLRENFRGHYQVLVGLPDKRLYHHVETKNSIEPVFPDVPGLWQPVRVVLFGIVDSAGNVAEAVVLESGGPAFDAAALTAFRQWNFTPATYHGQPVTCTVKLPLRFAPH